MGTIDFSKKPYVVCQDNYGYYFIDNSRTYAELVRETAEETTSPRGVEPKLQIGTAIDENGIETYFLFEWLCNCKTREGHRYYDTYEEAYNAWLECIYECDFFNDELSYYVFDKYDDAVECIAECLEVSIETAKSQLKWHKKLQYIFGKREGMIMMAQLKRAIFNAKGKPTKTLKRIIGYVKKDVQMWHNDYILSVPTYLSDKDLEILNQAKELLKKSF